MKVLLINNGSKRIKQIQEMLKDFSVTTIKVWELTKEDYGKDKYDFIILSGGHFARASTRQKTYDLEIDLIRNSNVPIFGICMGMQIIVRAFNDTYFAELRPKRRGVIEISYKDQKLNVFESHRFTVENVSSPLEKILSSEDGVEFIKHASKPIWGVQFHPEADEEFGTNGKLIFDEFISTIRPQ